MCAFNTCMMYEVGTSQQLRRIWQDEGDKKNPPSHYSQKSFLHAIIYFLYDVKCFKFRCQIKYNITMCTSLHSDRPKLMFHPPPTQNQFRIGPLNYYLYRTYIYLGNVYYYRDVIITTYFNYCCNIIIQFLWYEGKI